MAVFNYGKKEIDAKIVYYGPGLSGKTTNLQFVHKNLKAEQRGQMVSLATNEDRTLFFDFLPIELASVRGFKTRFHLYTVPGQVYYSGTRRVVLTGVDGIIFVADSHGDRMEDNLASFRDLEEHLRYYGKKVETIPLVIQYNKRDLPGALSVEVLNQKLNRLGSPYFEASAIMGNGVFEPLTTVCRLILKAIETGAGSRTQERAAHLLPSKESIRTEKAAAAPKSPPSLPEGIRPPSAESLQLEKPFALGTAAVLMEGAPPKPALIEKERVPLRSGVPAPPVLGTLSFQPAGKAVPSEDRDGASRRSSQANPPSQTELRSPKIENAQAERKPANLAVLERTSERKALPLKLDTTGGKKVRNVKKGVRILSCRPPRISSPNVLEIPLNLSVEVADKSFPFSVNISICLDQIAPDK